MRRLRTAMIAGLLLTSTAVAPAVAQAAPPTSASTVVGTAQPGGHLDAPVYSQPRYYTLDEQAALNARMFDEDDMDLGRPGPTPHGRALGADSPQPGGISPRTATMLRNNTIPASGISGGSSYSSYTQEPSTHANGGDIF